MILGESKIINMISLPDFKEKQILFIQAEHGVHNKIRFQNDNLVFLKNDEVVNRASCHKIFAAFIIGDLTITSGLLRDGLRHGVSFFFLKNNFDVYASVNAVAEGNYLLRMKQYSITPKDELNIAKQIVGNKIRNQFFLLKLKANKKDKQKIVSKEKQSISAINAAGNCETLMGLEGNVSKQFFTEYFNFIGWARRMPRIKPDIPNFLLDMGYTMLFNLIDALLRLHGFDTYRGIYHKLFFQRESLSCDIIEPFRCVIDRELLKMFNLKQIDTGDFSVEGGKYTVSFDKGQKYAKIFMKAIMNRKEDIYKYVKGFYRHVMYNEKNLPPFYSMRK